MRITASDISVKFQALKRVVYGQRSYIQVVGSRGSAQKIDVDHNVVRVFKRMYSQNRYPIGVLSALVYCGDRVVALLRHPNIFQNSTTGQLADDWKAMVEHTIAPAIRAIDDTFADYTFDGSSFLQETKHYGSLIANGVHVDIVQAKSVSLSQLIMQHFVKRTTTATSDVTALKMCGTMFGLPKGTLSDQLKEDSTAAIANLHNGRITLQFVETFANTICDRFGYEHMDVFDILSIIDTLKTLNIGNVDGPVKSNFYTSNTVVDVLGIVCKIYSQCKSIVDVDLIRRSVGTLFHRGYEVLPDTNDSAIFERMVEKVLRSGKTIADIEIADYDSLYCFHQLAAG